jgi:hypothetical protein
MSKIRGTHFQGPVLGSAAAKGGLYEDMPIAAFESVRSPYEIHIEDFNIEMADALIETSGFTQADVGTADTPAETIDAVNGFLLLDPGVGDDDGNQQKFDKAAAGTTTANPQFDIMGSFTSTATLMDQQELFIETRIGFLCESNAWQGKCVFGWITDDDALMTPSTGVLSIAAGGGAGFHVAEDGTLGYFSSNAAITTSTDSGRNVLTDTAALAGRAWYTLGFRIKWDDASAGTGHTDFYIDGKKVGTIVGTQPMDSTEVYAFVIEYLNGPAGKHMDVAIDWIISGRTRPGLSRPYTSGSW